MTVDAAVMLRCVRLVPGCNRAKWAHPYVRPHVNNEEGKECLTEGYTEK